MRETNCHPLLHTHSASGSYNGLETVVCTYIQAITGAVMHPSSRSYPGVEAIFRTTDDQGPETYGVQVKRGSFSDKDNLKQFADRHDRLFCSVLPVTRLITKTSRTSISATSPNISLIPPTTFRRSRLTGFSVLGSTWTSERQYGKSSYGCGLVSASSLYLSEAIWKYSSSVYGSLY